MDGPANFLHAAVCHCSALREKLPYGYLLCGSNAMAFVTAEILGMNRPATILSLCTAVLCFNSGCLFMRCNTCVVREKEKMRPVQFESERAQQFFVDGVHELQSHKQNSDVQVSAVPFLWLYATTKVMSDNAIYNDQISARATRTATA